MAVASPINIDLRVPEISPMQLPSSSPKTDQQNVRFASRQNSKIGMATATRKNKAGHPSKSNQKNQIINVAELISKANRNVRNFYEDYNKSEIDDLLTNFELQAANVVSKEPPFKLDDRVENILYQQIDTRNLEISTTETNKIIQELTVGIFAYNCLPKVEFIPSDRSLHCCKVHQPAPYKNTLVTSIMFKLLYKTNLLYAGSIINNETDKDNLPYKKKFNPRRPSFYKKRSNGVNLPGQNSSQDQDIETSSCSSGTTGNSMTERNQEEINFYTYKRGSYDNFEKFMTESELDGINEFSNSSLSKVLASQCHMLPKQQGEYLKEHIRQFQMQANPQSKKVQEMVSGNSKLTRLIDEHILRVDICSDIYLDDSHKSEKVKMFKVEPTRKTGVKGPYRLDLINPLPDKCAPNNIFDRFKRILDFHRNYCLEKIDDILTEKEKYLLHFINVIIAILVKMKRSGFKPNLDELKLAEDDHLDKTPTDLPPFIAAGPFSYLHVIRGRGKVALGSNVNWQEDGCDSDDAMSMVSDQNDESSQSDNCSDDFGYKSSIEDDPDSSKFLVGAILQAIELERTKTVFGTSWFPISPNKPRTIIANIQKPTTNTPNFKKSIISANPMSSGPTSGASAAFANRSQLSSQKSSISGNIQAANFTDLEHDRSRCILLETHYNERDKLLHEKLKESQNMPKSVIWSGLRQLLDDYQDIFRYEFPNLEKFRSEPASSYCRALIQLGAGVRLFHIILKQMKPGEVNQLDENNKALIHYCAAFDRPKFAVALLKTGVDTTIGKVSPKFSSDNISFSTTPLHDCIRCNSFDCFKAIMDNNKKEISLGVTRINLFGLMNYEKHYTWHSVVRHNRLHFYDYFDDYSSFLSKPEHKGIPTVEAYYNIHIAALFGCDDYFRSHFIHDIEYDGLNDRTKESVIELAVKNQHGSILQFYPSFEISRYFLKNIEVSLPVMIANPQLLNDDILSEITNQFIKTQSFDNDILTILANQEEITKKLSINLCTGIVKILMRKTEWQYKTQNGKNKILTLLTDFTKDFHENMVQKEFQKKMHEVIESSSRADKMFNNATRRGSILSARRLWNTSSAHLTRPSACESLEKNRSETAMEINDIKMTLPRVQVRRRQTKTASQGPKEHGPGAVGPLMQRIAKNIMPQRPVEEETKEDLAQTSSIGGSDVLILDDEGNPVKNEEERSDKDHYWGVFFGKFLLVYSIYQTSI